MQYEDYKGIAIPKDKGVPCGFCSNVIYKKNEAKGMLRITEKSKLPICAVCRVLGSRIGGAVRKNERAKDKDLALKEIVEQEKANQNALKTAKASQEATKTQIKKK